MLADLNFITPVRERQSIRALHKRRKDYRREQKVEPSPSAPKPAQRRADGEPAAGISRYA